MRTRAGSVVSRVRCALLLVALLLPLLPAGAAHTQADGRTFPETGKRVRGNFLDYWNTHGGLPEQGYPISDEMQERSDTDGKTYTVQYFERAVFEMHPENRAPNDVLLSLLGNFRYKQNYPNGAPNQKPNTVAGSVLFRETGKRLGGPFLAYWQSNGGLAQQGFPISDEFQERNELDGKTYTVQYFERAVFEAHPENQAPYDVLLSQLGTFRYRARNAAQARPAMEIDRFYEQVFLDLALRDPELFTSLGLPVSYKPDFKHNELTDVSDASLRRTNELVRQYLAQLKGYSPASQSAGQKLSTEILAWHLDDLVRGQPYMYHDYILNPVVGAQVNVQDLLTDLHPLNNKQQAEDYVARLQAFDDKFAGVMEQMKIREQKGIFMPRWMIERVSEQMRSFASIDATSNPLYTTFKVRLEPAGNISAGDKQALYAAAAKAINETVYPAYRTMEEYLDGIESKGRTTDGVWALPDGDAYYRQALRHHTTTDMSPEEIHNLGLREVARVTGEMKAELAKLGFDNGSLREGMDQVAEAGGVRRLNSQAAKDALVAEFRAAIDRADKNLSGQFDIRPRVGLEVRAVPDYKQAGAPGGFYFAPALDGSRPGIFYVNLGRQSFANYQIPTLAYHEGIPGHHFQLGIQSELQGVPTFRKTGVFPPATAYVEGWGLYAEKLAAELDLYKDDPYGNLGRLQAELFRSARLVVDTGIHWKRWSREQAIAYMDTTMPAPPGAYTGEVERYIAWPGQACGYKMGELKILELRDRARRELGSKFNIKAFHNVVLQNGSVPLSTLEKLVDSYIASSR